LRRLCSFCHVYRAKGEIMAPEEPKKESRQNGGAQKKHFVTKALSKAGNPASEGQTEQKKKGKAYIPSTLMTVEYIDDSEGMDAALSSLEERVAKLEGLLSSLQDSNSELVTAINRQAKEIQEFAASVGRRMDRIYRKVIPAAATTEPGSEPEVTSEPVTTEVTLPPEFAEDSDHQKAWRIARVLVADLEAYYPDKVREGVLYESLDEVLKQQIEEARKTYEQRAPQKVLEEFDHFSAALQAMTARKKQEVEQDLSS